MSMSGIFARIVALIGAVALLWRRLQGSAPAPAWGNAPAIPEAKPQGAHPDAQDADGAGAGATGRSRPPRPGSRSTRSRPASSIRAGSTCCPMATCSSPSRTQIAGPVRSVFDYAMQATMRRAAALGVSANRITLLRDARWRRRRRRRARSSWRD